MGKVNYSMSLYNQNGSDGDMVHAKINLQGHSQGTKAVTICVRLIWH